MPWQMGAICEIMQNLTMKLLGLADGSFVGKIGTPLPFGCGMQYVVYVSHVDGSDSNHSALLCHIYSLLAFVRRAYI